MADRLGRRWAPGAAGSAYVMLVAAVALVAIVVGATVAIFPTAARANAPVEVLNMTPSTTQAGGHPDIKTVFVVGNRGTQHIPAPSCNCEDAKNVAIHAPQGVIADPHAYPQCTLAEFGSFECPIDSQVGSAYLGVSESVPGDGGLGLMPVYNLEPAPEQAGLLGFNVPYLNFPVFVVVHPRTASDYGLDLTAQGLSHALPLRYLEMTLWGVPAASGHDGERLGPAGCDDTGTGVTRPPCIVPNPSNVPPAPFIENPTQCNGPLSASIDVLAYDLGTSSLETSYPESTGCDQLSFNPSLTAEPTTQQADSASGLEVDLRVPQLQSPTTPSPSEISATTVTLPEGFSINPNAADGKTSCSDAEARIGTEEEGQCPEFAKVGTLSIDSSALPGPLPGYIYIGQPRPGDPYRLILVADGYGIHVKLTGSVLSDPNTGQLTVSFQELPETPFQEFNMHFFGSERGLLATPTQCGTYPVTSTFTPWDTALPAQTSTQYFSLNSGPDGEPCPSSSRPFTPQLVASTAANTAGAHSPFALKLTRPDGDQNLNTLTITTPPGLLATLKGIPYCSDTGLETAANAGYSGSQEIADPSCPAASQIGEAVAGAGAGTHPVYLSGKVYLAGPYKGAPLSLAVITPAVSGPYDLGNVVVRAALRVNPETAQITAVSDPFPQILGGIPLRLRSILINLNRSNFTINPTNCDPLHVNGQITGNQGASVSTTELFQAANCETLPFAARLSTEMSGSTKHTGNPALRATLTLRGGGSDIASTSVTLPKSELIDNTHIKNPCTRVQFSANDCPGASVVGFAKAETPLLEKPLEGPVYLRSAPENKSGLPDLVAALKGQIAIDLDGKIQTVGGRIRTTFGTVPDAPVDRFTLSLDGGKRGLLENSESLCRGPLYASARLVGQNGKTASQTLLLQTPCPKRAEAKRHIQHLREVG